MAEAVATAVPIQVRERTRVDWLTPLLVAIFVLSGASGLIYQITWIRLLSLTFGVTIYAVSTVVAAFMGGLALGSFLGGRLADRARYPIIWYAIAEFVIALVGVKSIDLLAWVQSVYLAVYPREAESAVLGIVALRFGLAALVVMIPTTLMGATLPLMVRGSLALGTELGTRVSWLYASNTTGAILGTLAAGYFLIGFLGIEASILVAATLNTAAAIPALLIGVLSRGQQASEPAAAHAEVARAAGPAIAPGVRAIVIATFAVQGFASLAYEVVWTRVFAVLLDGTTYAFSIVLATVLLGIAIGSAMISPLISRPGNWIRFYAFLQAGVALFGFLGVLVISRIYGITSLFAGLPWLGGAMEEMPSIWMGLAAAVVILPVMLLLGMSFPVAARIVVAARGSTGRDLGILYAGNTAGAILGAWMAGFFLLPSLGSQLSIELIAGINGVLAMALAVATGGRPLAVAFGAGVVLAWLSVAVGLVPNMYQRMLAGRFPNTEVVWVGEGLESTVTVVRESDGDLTMYFNGRAQASDNADVLWFHRLLGHLPMALHPNPQEVLIVGVGGGATASALAKHEPQRLDIVELSEIAMVGARYFEHVNGDILGRPFVHLKIDDGRNHLLLTNRRYDLITADVVYPRNAGAAFLYSYDYFNLASKILKPGGLMAQWLVYEGDFEDTEALRKIITRSFAAAFPYVSMWVNGSLLIGSNQPLDLRESALAANWLRPRIGPLLQEVGVSSPAAAGALLLLDDRQLRVWAGEGPLMTDNHPYSEFYRSLPRE